MYTIDEMIERLKELREIAPDGGKTPVVVYHHDGTCLEPAAADLQFAYKRRIEDRWFIDDAKNDCTVLLFF